MVYILSYRTAKATQRHSVSKNQSMHTHTRTHTQGWGEDYSLKEFQEIFLYKFYKEISFHMYVFMVHMCMRTGAMVHIRRSENSCVEL